MEHRLIFGVSASILPVALEDFVVELPTHTEVGANRMLPRASDVCKDLKARRAAMKRELERIDELLGTDMSESDRARLVIQRTALNTQQNVVKVVANTSLFACRLPCTTPIANVVASQSLRLLGTYCKCR